MTEQLCDIAASLATRVLVQIYGPWGLLVLPAFVLVGLCVMLAQIAWKSQAK